MERFLEDWQGCLSPECQVALVQARDGVHQRGGSVVTAEDYLLALLESSAEVTGFLRRAGVDLDELIRTVQCEQPLVTEVGREGSLSSQLLAWFAAAREVCDQSWLDWIVLLRVLASGMERLRDKAYVAVLEVVGTWPEAVALLPETSANDQFTPLVVTDSEWLSVAEDIAVTMAASSRALVWLKGARGSGKSSLLQCALEALDQNYRTLDPRNAKSLSDLAEFKSRMKVEGVAEDVSVLVLDNCTPEDLLILVEQSESELPGILADWAGPILLAGTDSTPEACRRLEHWLGRSIDAVEMPSASQGQQEAILTAHQPVIEKRWQIEIPLPVVRFAASCGHCAVLTPGGLLKWVERAAARLDLFARRGPTEALAIAGQTETARRQFLLELARPESDSAIRTSLENLHVHKTAVEVAWHERRQSGTLRQLGVADLQAELERWLAAEA